MLLFGSNFTEEKDQVSVFLVYRRLYSPGGSEKQLKIKILPN